MNDIMLPLDKVERTQLPAASASESASLMEVISRAAADPNTDVDKLERLLGMYERITDRQAEAAYAQAMSDAQAEMRPVATNANNSQTKSKYASYAALDEALRPIYAKHGFALSFSAGDNAPADHVRVTCKVSHRGGHIETHQIDMPADGKGAKGGDVMTKTHATGAAMTYGQRYLLRGIFNIAVFDDDDGNGAGKSDSPVTPAQVETLNILADSAQVDKRRFCEWLKVESFAALQAKAYIRAERALQDVIAKKAAQVSEARR